MKTFMEKNSLTELIDSKSLYRFPRAALAKMLGVKPWGLKKLLEGGKPPKDNVKNLERIS